MLQIHNKSHTQHMTNKYHFSKLDVLCSCKQYFHYINCIVCNQLVNKQIYNETRITSKSCNNYSNLMTKCMAMVECTNISCKQQTFKFQYY